MWLVELLFQAAEYIYDGISCMSDLGDFGIKYWNYSAALTGRSIKPGGNVFCCVTDGISTSAQQH